MTFRIFLLLFLLSSCSSTSNLITQFLIDTNALKTMKNQDFSKLKSEGAFLLAGRVELYNEGKRIDGICGISFNDLDERTGVVFYPEDLFIASIVKKGRNRIVSIQCGAGSESPAFEYVFNDRYFAISNQVNHFGLMKIYFAEKRGEDGFKKYVRTKPSIEKIVFEDNEELLNEILSFFNVKKSSKIDIIQGKEISI